MIIGSFTSIFWFHIFLLLILSFITFNAMDSSGRESNNELLLHRQKEMIDSLSKTNMELNLKADENIGNQIIAARFDGFKFWATIFITIFLAVGILSIWNVHRTAREVARDEAEKEMEKMKNQYSSFRENLEKSFVGWFQQIKEKEAFNRQKGRKQNG